MLYNKIYKSNNKNMQNNKKGYHKNIENLTLENENFRKVEYTADHMQLVLMSLNPKEEIGVETHNENDQFFRFESGNGKVIINGNIYEVSDGSAIIIPAGSEHNIINTSETEKLKMYTIYAIPHHADQTIHSTKTIAENSHEEWEGETTE